MSARDGRPRVYVVAALFLGFFCVAALQVVRLGVVDAQDLAARGERQRNRTIVLPAERGPILDRNGDALAMTVESASIFVRPRLADLDEAQVTALAAAAGRSPAYVSERLASGKGFAWLRRNATPAQADAVAYLDLAGVGSEPSRTRVYPRGPLAGQILGLAGIDGQGLEGLELAFDRHLRAEPEAVVVERDARGRYIVAANHARRESPRGARVELTLDADLQRTVEASLARAVREREAASGVAIVMDVSTGEVLAMANAPLFDPNLREHRKPSRWRNRAILDRFEPGSTFKSFLAAAAIEAGTVWPEKRIFCERGRYRIGRRAIHDHEPQGWLTFQDVIRVSSNIGVAKAAEELGAERLHATLQAFGFGAPTGIDLAAEASGVLPPVAAWRAIHLATISYGHGVSVTPLQLVRGYSALANGGRLMRPYVVSRVVGDDGSEVVRNQPQVVGLAVSPRTARVVTDMLESVVRDGTGKPAAIDGVAVAGKTGTTRKIDPETGRYSRRDYIASFVGYFPADAPRLASVRASSLTGCLPSARAALRGARGDRHAAQGLLRRHRRRTGVPPDCRLPRRPRRLAPVSGHGAVDRRPAGSLDAGALG